MHASPRSSIIRSRHSRLAIRRIIRRVLKLRRCVPPLGGFAPAAPRKPAGTPVALNIDRGTGIMLQRVSGCLPSTVEIGAIVCHAFDVLYLVGRKLRRLPLHERRHCWSRSSPGQAQGCAHDHQRSLEKALANRIDSRATMEVALNSFNAASFFPDRVSRSGRWRQLWPAARSRSWRRTTIRQRQMPRHPRQSQWRRQ